MIFTDCNFRQNAGIQTPSHLNLRNPDMSTGLMDRWVQTHFLPVRWPGRT